MVHAALWVFFIILIYPSESHPDCEKHRIVYNIHRVCRSYPQKRNTRDFNEGFVIQNDLDPWNFIQGPTFPPPHNFLQGNQISSSSRDSSNPGPWQPVVWYPTVTLPRNLDVVTLEDLFDPLNYGGAEVQLPVERWRRVNKELVQQIDGFIRHECCNRGCAFPSAYEELAQRTNLCNHQ